MKMTSSCKGVATTAVLLLISILIASTTATAAASAADDRAPARQRPCNPEAYLAQHEESFTMSSLTNNNANTLSSSAPAAPTPPPPPPNRILVGGADVGPEAPACLDGSPYGFYWQPSQTNSTKWTVQIQGGGWCYDEVDCLCRASTRLGSSHAQPDYSRCQCLNPNPDGSIDLDCNCLYLPYSDGASFSGYRSLPHPVPGNATAQIWFRGIKNLDAVMQFAVDHGLNSATEFVVTGGSAGGLSTLLHADRVAERVRQVAPSAKVHAAPVVGYFLDHDNFKHTTGYPGGPNTPQWSTPGTGANYTMWMKYIYGMQNLTFGADGGLTAACHAKYPDQPHLCFMSPHMNVFIDTPFFVFNGKYDAWQLGNEFQSGWTTKAEQLGVLQYGKDFMAQFAAVQSQSKNGAFITSCICHGCYFPALKLHNKTAYQHYADWYYGKTTGAGSIHIDTRTPNGDNTITDMGRCSKWPGNPSAIAHKF